jgi:hypothetical protein
MTKLQYHARRLFQDCDLFAALHDYKIEMGPGPSWNMTAILPVHLGALTVHVPVNVGWICTPSKLRF